MTISNFIQRQSGCFMVCAPLIAFGYAWGVGYFHFAEFAWLGWFLVIDIPVAAGIILIDRSKD